MKNSKEKMIKKNNNTYILNGITHEESYYLNKNINLFRKR